MIFQHTIDKVLSGEKTQTRRIVKLNHHALNIWRTELGDDLRVGMLGDGNRIGIVQSSGRDMWRVLSDYAVQPGRGKPAVARIRITNIRQEDVRGITPEDARAEGFVSSTHFMLIWTKMHDPQHYNRYPTTGQQSLAWGNGVLENRPSELYTAWVIQFELVK